MPGIAWIDPGRRLAPSHANGIQGIDVDPTANPPTLSIGGFNSTGGGAFGAVAVANNGTLFARAVGQGLELYALPATGNPTRCGSSNQGVASVAGVALTSHGNGVFRATVSCSHADQDSAVTVFCDWARWSETKPLKSRDH